MRLATGGSQPNKPIQLKFLTIYRMMASFRRHL
jgi:hypothetical protein